VIVGQSVLGSTDGYDYFGPWMSREADSATFVAEVLFDSGSFSLDIVVQHKNTEDIDTAAATAASFSSISTRSTSSVLGTGLKELVRYKYTVTGSAATCWVHLRMNPPLWQPN